MTQQPPAAPTLHPKRCVLSCDSCEHAEKSNSRSYPFKCLITKPVPMMVHEYSVSWFGYVGCASHSSTPDADARQRVDELIVEKEQWMNNFLCEQQRVEGVVKELKRLNRLYEEDFNGRVDCPQKYESQGIALMACRAIALLKGGVVR